jgi:hypothetical protein
VIARFDLDDAAGLRAFLDKAERALALMRGVGCVYSTAFEPAFVEIEPPPGWLRCVRLVEEGGRGPVADAHGVDITPTVVAFADGREVARLDGKLLLGIPRTKYKRWLATL